MANDDERESIWKYEIEVGPPFELNLPCGASVLHVEAQHGKPMMWVRVHVNSPKVGHRFVVIGTGHGFIPDGDAVKLEHRGTFFLSDGNFVGHLFELVEV